MQYAIGMYIGIFKVQSLINYANVSCLLCEGIYNNGCEHVCAIKFHSLNLIMANSLSELLLTTC